MTSKTSSNSPIRLSRPQAVADLVVDAGQKQKPIVDYGIAHAGLGHPPPPNHFLLQLHGSVIEHYERDLAVRTSAGITIGELQTQLAPHRQFLPLDADDDLTLGEVISHNVYGPLRAGFGAVRDLMLGLHYIDGRGRDIHVGGRTVKNVAGYDVTRFMAGSLGQFGIVHEATVRTYAIPEQATAVTIQCNDAGAVDELIAQIVLTDANPTHCLLQRSESNWSMHIGYFGRRRACAMQRNALQGLIDSEPGCQVTDSHELDLATDTAHRAKRRRWKRNVTALVKIIVPPASTGATCQKLFEWSQEQSGSFHIDALPMHGCVFAGGDLDAPTAKKLNDQINPVVQSIGGMRGWYIRPGGAETIEPFAPPQRDWSILASLKQSMDPQNLFNPERFIRLGNGSSGVSDGSNSGDRL